MHTNRRENPSYLASSFLSSHGKVPREIQMQIQRIITMKQNKKEANKFIYSEEGREPKFLPGSHCWKKSSTSSTTKQTQTKPRLKLYKRRNDGKKKERGREPTRSKSFNQASSSALKVSKHFFNSPRVVASIHFCPPLTIFTKDQQFR